MADILSTNRRQINLDRDALWRDYRSSFTLPRASKDLIGTYRPTYGMAE